MKCAIMISIKFYLFKQMNQLGSGGEATVYGPLHYSQMQLFLTTRQIQGLDPKQQFIVKVFHRPKSFEEKKKKLIETMKKIPYPENVLLPLFWAKIPRKKVETYFPKVATEHPSIPIFDLEVQRFGGQDLFGYLFEPLRKNIPASTFFKIWEGVRKIIADCFVWIVQHDLMITDIKPENMVIDQQNTLRLIDVSAYPPDKSGHTLTLDLQLLPSQYFNSMFMGTSIDSWEKRKTRFVQKASRVYNLPVKTQFARVLRQIHNNEPSFADAFRNYSNSLLERKDAMLFFVIYPLFILMLRLILVNKVITINDNDREKIDRIREFCIEILKRRGRIIHQGDPNMGMKHFLTAMKM